MGLNSPQGTSAFTSAGHFDAALRPSPHDPERLSPAGLENFLRRHAVRMRGWPLPFMDERQPIRRHASWISQEYTGPRHQEAWRLFTSGQFLHRRLLVSDLTGSADLQPDAPGATGSVVVWDVLLYTVELTELAARFVTDLVCNDITIECSLVNIDGRQLVSGEWTRELFGPYLIAADRLKASRKISTIDLLADPRGIAVTLVQKLLTPFGLDLSDKVLADWQEQIFQRR